MLKELLVLILEVQIHRLRRLICLCHTLICKNWCQGYAHEKVGTNLLNQHGANGVLAGTFLNFAIPLKVSILLMRNKCKKTNWERSNQKVVVYALLPERIKKKWLLRQCIEMDCYSINTLIKGFASRTKQNKHRLMLPLWKSISLFPPEKSEAISSSSECLLF